MSNQSPQEFRELVRSHNDIVSVIGESIALQARSGGREHVGLCPFHDDKNPSMRVYSDRQTFRCWSCNTGGDVFSFLMEREKISFPEAIEILARRANLEVPKHIGGKTPEQQNNRAKLFEVLQWAENEFQNALWELPVGQPALQYLRERGFSDEMIRKFKLGFHPDDWTWIVDKARGRYDIKLLLETRLIGERNGRHFDYFKNRVLFPIHNERGQAVSFGGRILPGSDDSAKYFNGLESIVFHKSRLLYAIDKARDEVINTGTIIVTEGYTDCLACHQAGVTNVVATLGTALTDTHVTAIKRFAKKVVLVFDGDEAGQKAAKRSVEAFLAQDVDLRILTLPQGQDPADFITENGADEFNRQAEKALEAWQFSFQAAIREHGLSTLDGKHRVLNDMLHLLAKVPKLATSVRESFLIANLAQRLSLTEATVREELQKKSNNDNTHIRIDNAEEYIPEEDSYAEEVALLMNRRMSQQHSLECDLLEITFATPQFMGWVSHACKECGMTHGIFKRIFAVCEEEVQLAETLNVSSVLNRFEDSDLKNLIVWIDEQAGAKNICKKIAEGKVTEDGCPEFIHQTIQTMKYRQDDQTHHNEAVQLSQSRDGQSELNDSIEEQLRRAQEYHKQAAARETPRLTEGS